MRLTEYAIPKAKAFNLLGEEENEYSKMPGMKIGAHTVSHLRSKMTFTIMADDIKLPFNNIPLELSRNLRYQSF